MDNTQDRSPARIAALSEANLPGFRDELVGLARHLGLPPDAAEDAAQACLLGALRQLRAGREIARPRPYLKTALRHACARARLMPPPREAEEEIAVAGDSAFRHLQLEEVCRAIATLPPDQARLLSRVADGQTSPDALAAEFGVPRGTIMSRLARGRTRLRAALGMAESETFL